MTPEVFLEVQGTPCPFAGRGSYVGLTVRRASDLPKAVVALRIFSLRQEFHRSHMFALAVNPAVHSDSIPELGALFRHIVHNANDGPAPRAQLYAQVESTNWRLHINGRPMFALVLSPCYSTSHPRKSTMSTLLLFQPEVLFDNLGITTNKQRQRYTETSARSFHRAGREYHHAHALGIPKAFRVVLDHNGSGIRWWLSPERDF